jgi:hypothetical protein
MQEPRGQAGLPRLGRPPIWLIAAALGAGAAVLAAVIGVFGIFFVLLIIPGMGARTWLAATSGALTGFGATMLALLLLRPATAGGAGDDATLLMLAAVLPLVVGLLLGAIALIAARST